MIRLTVISVGSLKESYLSAAVAEYEKRLSAFCRIENIELKEARIRNEDDGSEIAAFHKRGKIIRRDLAEGKIVHFIKLLICPRCRNALAVAGDYNITVRHMCAGGKYIADTTGYADSLHNAESW